MTVLIPLKARLQRARVALITSDAQASLEQLLPVIDAGVDLLILGASGNAEADAEVISQFRATYGTRPLLLGTDGADAAKKAQADVVYLERPGWGWFGYPSGHEYSLLGRSARDARTVANTKDDFDFLFVGPDRTALVAASQRESASGPVWFAKGSVQQVRNYIETGVARVAFGPDLIDSEDAAREVAWAAAQLRPQAQQAPDKPF